MKSTAAIAAGFLVVMAALYATAGTRVGVVNQGSIPTHSLNGVSLQGAVACRAIIYVADAGSIMGGSLVPYYWDDVRLVWQEGASAAACTLDTTVQIDAGNRLSQVCEFTVQQQQGRAAVVSKSIVNAAGAAAYGAVRLECWGPTINPGSFP